MEPKDMGTTGLIQWIWAAENFQQRGQRKRRALAIMQARYGTRVLEVFKRALAASTVNRSCKQWALR
jgi:hypothetical protein